MSAKPIPSRGANRNCSPRLIAIISSVISFTIVASYYYFVSEKRFGEIREKGEKDYLSSTPELAAERFLAALTENRIETALELCKGSTREAILDGSIFRHLTRTRGYQKKTPRIDGAETRQLMNASIDTAYQSQESAGTAPEAAATRAQLASYQSAGQQNPPSSIGITLAPPRKPNHRFRLLEPLVFSVREYHKKGGNRVLLVGTSEGKNTGSKYFGNIEVTVERSDSRWYVSRIVFK